MSDLKSDMRAPASIRSRLLFVDDHPIVLDGYQTMLKSQPDLELCGLATNAAEALQMFQDQRPNLMVMDLSLPGRGGLDLLKDILALDASARVLVCSMHDEMLYAERALRAGAKGYVMKDCSATLLLSAIQRVLAGGIHVSERLAVQVLETFAGTRPRGSHSPLEKLSDREFEVFVLFGEGRTAKEIGAKLNLSPKTVSVHRDHIKEKMEFSTSAEMIRQAVRWVESQSVKGSPGSPR
ncbi:MAG TPA: response regulator transcription factor [Chthoniobacter sp.]|nr:response regulator transcription factor [Chthoniobacter sp.]